MKVTYDSVTAANIPEGSLAFSYANGRYANTTAISQRATVVGQVDVSNSSTAPYRWLDIENGDATPDDAAGFMRRGGTGVYCSESAWPTVINALNAAGYNAGTVPFWIASYKSSTQPTTLPTIAWAGVQYTAAGHQYWDDGAKDISVWADDAPLNLPTQVTKPSVNVGVNLAQPTPLVKVKPAMQLAPSGKVVVDYLTNGPTTVLLWDDGSTWLVRSGFPKGAITSPLDARLGGAFKGRVAATLKAFGSYGFVVTDTAAETYRFGA